MQPHRHCPIIQRDSKRVRLWTRSGHDWSDWFPLITEAALRNRCTSFKYRPPEGALVNLESSVLKLGHGLQFVLGGVIHQVIRIPTTTGCGCGGGRGGSYGTGGGSLATARPQLAKADTAFGRLLNGTKQNCAA